MVVAACGGSPSGGEGVGQSSSAIYLMPPLIAVGTFDAGCYTDGFGNVACWQGPQGVNTFSQANYGGPVGPDLLAEQVFPGHTSTPQDPSAGYVPEVVSLGKGQAKSLAVGQFSACVVLMGDSTVWCWGENLEGQLGPNCTQDGCLTPVQVVDASGAPIYATEVSGNQNTYCVVTTNGGALCWGDNSNQEIGNPSVPSSPTPLDGATWSAVPVAPTGLGPGTGVVSVAEAGDHGCAALASGEAVCWGENTYGQLGTFSNVSSATPVEVFNGGLTSAKKIFAGWATTCAIDASGPAYCWGQDDEAQLGTDKAGSDLLFSWPQTVYGGTSYSAMTLNGVDACAIDGTTAYCWGDNQNFSLYAPAAGDTAAQKKAVQDIDKIAPTDYAGSLYAIATGTGTTCRATTGFTYTCVDVNGSHAIQ